jgi:hypothetical protein
MIRPPHKKDLEDEIKYLNERLDAADQEARQLALTCAVRLLQGPRYKAGAGDSDAREMAEIFYQWIIQDRKTKRIDL